MKNKEMIPNNLPPIESFAAAHGGRRDIFAQLNRIFFEDEIQVVSLVGVKGIGKTSLAKVYARSVLEHHPGGVWWMKTGERGFAKALLDLSETLSVSGPASVVDQVRDKAGARPSASVVNALGGGGLQTFLVVDELREKLPKDLSIPGNVRVLITTRFDAAVEGQRIDVGELRIEEARAIVAPEERLARNFRQKRELEEEEEKVREEVLSQKFLHPGKLIELEERVNRTAGGSWVAFKRRQEFRRRIFALTTATVTLTVLAIYLNSGRLREPALIVSDRTIFITNEEVLHACGPAAFFRGILLSSGATPAQKKNGGHVIDVPQPPGNYDVLLECGGAKYQASVHVPPLSSSGERLILHRSDAKDVH